MKEKFVLLLALATAFAAPSSASAESFKTFWKTFEPNLVKAFETGNVKFFDDNTTSDYIAKSPMGTMNKAQSLAEMKSSFGAAKKITCKVKTVSMKVSKDTATTVVWMQADMVMSIKGKDHTYLEEEDATQKWVKVGSKWKVKEFIEGKPIRSLMDGKPIKG